MPMKRSITPCRNLTVQRIFALDSQGMGTVQEMLHAANPHFMEIMPGVIGKAIMRFRKSGIPVIAGGLLEEKSDILAVLGAGALCVSTTDRRLWQL